ncbi:ArsA-related P-loop ATPase [Streptomyces uncialis]|uniref:ArsA-related P-loop ATPase n=1 Tax=Streptomyces uncialis TaxID=1048205 RepID=UPI00378EB648
MTPSADRTAGSGPAEDAGSEDGLRARRTLAVDPLLDDPRTRIVVCCGAGGVGKTTTAAALGLRAAERGRKVVVLTIDPARRLAQSMGIDSLDNTPRRVKGIDNGAGGELHAMMLDMKRTFDEIVEAHADPERAAAILGNPFYQSLSAGFAGTQEYMAMEKLGQLRARDEWDLIVVDTPPSRSALDFLDAPKRLGSFLDGKLIRVLMAPAKVGGRAGMKFLNVGMSMMTGALGKLLGGQLLRDVQTFVAAMDTMFGGFRTRADATYRLLQAPGTAFLVVAAPERDALREAAYFVERLAAEDMPLAGLVLNRVHVSGAAHLPAERALAAAESLGEHLTGTGTDDHHTGTSTDDHPAGTGADDHRRDPGADDHHARAAEPSATRAGAAPGGHPDTDGPAAEHLDPENLADSGIVDQTAGQAGLRSTPASPGSPTPPEHHDRPRPDSPEHHDDTPAPRDTHRTKRSADPQGPARLTVGLLRLHAERMQLLDRERRTRDRFTALHPEVAVAEVGALPGDVHDLAGLRDIGDRLAGPGPTGEPPA